VSRNSDLPNVRHQVVSLGPGEILILQRAVIEAQLSFVKTKQTLEASSEMTLVRLEEIERLLQKIVAQIDALLWAVRE
jgi:hypothetical protein